MPNPIRDKGVRRKSSRLEGKRLAVGVCGGIGAVEVVKIIRELRRHGAEVHPFMTPAVERFLTDLPLSWAAGRPVVREVDVGVDHLEDYDLVLVAPATLNTLAKAAAGIADNAVTLLIAGQLGAGRPVVCFPTMNSRLRAHPHYGEMLGRLGRWGVRFPESEEEEGRLKMPSPERVVDAVLEALA